MQHDPSAPLPAVSGSDRALFARVWARVAPGEGEGCPIEVLPPSDPAPEAALSPPAGAPAEAPELDPARFLQESVRRQLDCRRSYRELAARGGPAAPVLAALAAEKRDQARRLSAACFLLTGVRFFPALPPSPARPEPFWGALRALFWQERRFSSLYAAAGAGAADPDLSRLYFALSAECAAHACRLRRLTETL